MTAQATEAAPAKINLDLHVTGKRFDGYHELDSLVVFTAFGDRLSYEPASHFSLEVRGPFADQTPIADNLILQAADCLAREQKSIRPLAFRLEKNLPVASGMGGGSADAAAAMRAIVKSSDLQMDDERLRDIAATLGADMPVCIYGKSARMRGTGLRLDPVRGLPTLPIVLVNPGAELATAKVFQTGSFQDKTCQMRSAMPVNGSVTSFAVWLQASRNDLEEPARQLCPEINDVIESIQSQDGCLVARMTGSGATCFGIFTDDKRADRAAELIRSGHENWWTIATRSLSEVRLGLHSAQPGST